MSHEFIPKQGYLENIKSLLNQYKSKDNSTHKELSKALSDSCNQIEYPCYLLNIFNEKSNEIIIRQLAGICIKNYLEKFSDISRINSTFSKHFNRSGLTSLKDENITIRNTLGNIISTFIKIGGFKIWKELPIILIEYLDLNDIRGHFGNALEIVNFIVEDLVDIFHQSGNEKEQLFIVDLITKIKENINICLNPRFYENASDICQQIILQLLIIINNLIKKRKPSDSNINSSINKVFFNAYDSIYQDLVSLNNLFPSNYLIKEKIGKIWIKIFKNHEREVLIQQFNYFFRLFIEMLEEGNISSLSDPYNRNHNVYYDINICSLDFFDFLLLENDNYEKLIIGYAHVYEIFINNLPRLINSLVDKISLIHAKREYTNTMDEDLIVEFDDVVNTSVRQSAAILLEVLAYYFPESVFENSKHSISKGLNSSDPIEKEKGIHIITTTGNKWFNNFPEHSEALIKILLETVNDKTESRIVRLQSIYSLICLNSYILKELLNKKTPFMSVFEDFLNNILLFIQTDDEKFQLISINFILFFIEKFTSDSSFYQIKEMMLPLIDELVRILLLFLESNMNDNNKIKVKQKAIDFFEYILINYSNVLANSLNFKQFIVFLQKQSLKIKVEDLENKMIYVYLIQLIPYLLENLFHLCVNDTNGNNNYLLNLLNHIQNLMIKTYKDLLNGIENSCIHDLIPNITDLLNSIIKFSLKNRYNNEKFFCMINDDRVYESLLFYGQRTQVLMNKFFQYIAELARIPRMPLIDSHLEEILIYLVEFFKSFKDPDEIFINLETNFIISNAIYALGNIGLNYNDYRFRSYCAYIIELILVYFKNNTTQEIGENLIYTLGKLSLIFPDIVIHYFKDFLKCYFTCFRILKVCDSEDKFLSLKGIVEAFMLEKNKLLPYFCELSLALISYDELPSLFKNIYTRLYTHYLECCPEKLADIINSLKDQEKCEIEQKLLNTNGNTY